MMQQTSKEEFFEKIIQLLKEKNLEYFYIKGTTETKVEKEPNPNRSLFRDRLGESARADSVFPNPVRIYYLPTKELNLTKRKLFDEFSTLIGNKCLNSFFADNKVYEYVFIYVYKKKASADEEKQETNPGREVVDDKNDEKPDKTSSGEVVDDKNDEKPDKISSGEIVDDKKDEKPDEMSSGEVADDKKDEKPDKKSSGEVVYDKIEEE